MDYDTFKNATLEEISNIWEFFPEKDTIIWEEEDSFITYSIENYKKNYGMICSSAIENILHEWKNEESGFMLEFQNLNRALISAFDEATYKVIDFEHFEEFLKDLDVEISHNRVKVSSYHSGYICLCPSYDYLTEAIDSYLQEIVKRKDVIFLDFNVGDEFYWCCLCEHFGYPPDDEDEDVDNDDDDGDDDDGGDQEENVPVPV